MMRPLYLDAAPRWSVRLDDGPALHVSAPGRARSLVPLRRVARVVCPAHTEWATPALVACLRAGIPVLFHDSTGEPLGWCFGPRRRETTLGSLLREAFGRADGPALIGAWRNSAQRRELLAALQAARLVGPAVDARDGRARLCNHHRHRVGRPVGAHLRALQRSCAALVAERLHDMVGDPALIGFAVPGLHLGELMADLLEWRLHRVLCQTPVGEFLVAASGPFAAALLERHGPGLDAGCGELLGDLERHLREALL